MECDAASPAKQAVDGLASAAGQLRHYSTLAPTMETPARGFLLQAALQEVDAAAAAVPPAASLAAVPPATGPAGAAPSVSGTLSDDEPACCAAGSGAADSSCVICHAGLAAGERYTRLPCSHVFHESCLAPWLRLHDSCPSCRRVVDIDISAAAEELSETVSRCRVHSPNGIEQVLWLADRLTGNMSHRLRHAALLHNESNACLLVWLLEVDAIRANVLGALSVRELWRLRVVSKAFGRFCDMVLGELPGVLAAGGVGGVSGSVVLRTADTFSFRTMRWEPSPPMHFARFDPAACPLGGGGLFVAGGAASIGGPGRPLRPDPRVAPMCLCGTEARQCAEVYTASTQSWRLTAPMPEARVGARAVSVTQRVAKRSTERVFVLGGVGRGRTADDPGRFLSSVSVWDAASDTWSEAPPMLNRRADFGATAVHNSSGSRLIVAGGLGFGGTDDGEEEDDDEPDPWSALAIEAVEVYDMTLQTWACLPDVSIPREGCLLARVGGSGDVGVFGGVGPDPNRCDWDRDVPILEGQCLRGRSVRLPRGCVGHAVSALEPRNDSVLVFGGLADVDQELHEGTSTQGTSMQLHTRCDGWVRLPSMPTERAAFAFAACVSVE